jgi:hypothetical protein
MTHWIQERPLKPYPKKSCSLATCGGAAASCGKGIVYRLFTPFGFALVDDGGVETGANLVGKRVNLVIAVDLNGLLGGIADNMAIAAPHEVIFEIGL